MSREAQSSNAAHSGWQIDQILQKPAARLQHTHNVNTSNHLLSPHSEDVMLPLAVCRYLISETQPEEEEEAAKVSWGRPADWLHGGGAALHLRKRAGNNPLHTRS